MLPSRTGAGECCRCGEPTPPAKPGYPRKRLFCSNACRTQFWDAKHPRQKPLDFTPPTEPALKLTPTIARHAAGKFQRACWRCLDRLERGPAFGNELEALAGRRFGARLGQLRPYLRALCGFNPSDKTMKPILCSDPKDGTDPVYMLAVWAEPGNRPHGSADGAGGEG